MMDAGPAGPRTSAGAVTVAPGASLPGCAWRPGRAAGDLYISVHLRVVALAGAEGGLRRPPVVLGARFSDGSSEGSVAGARQRSLGLRKSSGRCVALLIVEGGSGLFAAMAHLSTLYKGARVPLFFIMGLVEG